MKYGWTTLFLESHVYSESQANLLSPQKYSYGEFNKILLFS